MNRQSPLSVEEWQGFIAENSQNEAVRMIISILDDAQPKLNLPSELIVPVISSMAAKMTAATQLGTTLQQIDKFLPLVSSQESAPAVFEGLKSAAKAFANSAALSNTWPEKFNAVFDISLEENVDERDVNDIIQSIKTNLRNKFPKMKAYIKAEPKYVYNL